MGVRRCPKCGSVWYSELVKCAFCGVEGEEVKGPISPAKLNLGRKGVEVVPGAGAAAAESASPVATAEAKESAEPVKAEAPPPQAPEPPKEVHVDPPKVERPLPKIEEPAPERKPDPLPPPPSFAPPREAASEGKPKPERVAPPRHVIAARMEALSSPAPAIPSSMVPLVFGCLGLASAALLPLTWFVQHDKIKMTFAVLAWAILAPFAPFAWLTAQRYADQCRTLGFIPAPGANTGKLLGMIACFLTVFEFSGLAVFIVVQILAGKIHCPLWK